MTRAELLLIRNAIEAALAEIEQAEDFSQGVEDDLREATEVLSKYV